MNICDYCLDKLYENTQQIYLSYTRCEECGKTVNCNKIHNKDLQLKRIVKHEGDDINE